MRELMDEVSRLKAERDAEAHSFKNLHRLLCDRFDYTHDETDWKRDQVSLIEWIASRIATLTARIEALHLMQELGEDLAWRSYLGIQVLQTVLKKSKLEAGADVSAKLLTDIAIQYPHFPAKSALRPMPARRELENKP